MERRCFMAVLAAPVAIAQTQNQAQEKKEPAPSLKPPRYKMEIEIFEARKDSWCHKQGDKFEYPKDIGRMCPWLFASMQDMLLLLGNGVTLPWKYEGTPYQKVIDPNGVTTEYIRCPDPTSNLVAKITRTRV